MQVPTRAEICVFDSLDELRAVRNFLGRDVAAAELLLRENASHYCEDLMWMGPVAFRYYVRAAIEYVRSAHSAGDAPGIAAFVTIVEFRVDTDDRAQLTGSARELTAVCDYIVDNAPKFGFGEFYGDVPARCSVLREKLAQLADSAQA